jgi:hypothetical protein
MTGIELLKSKLTKEEINLLGSYYEKGIITDYKIENISDVDVSLKVLNRLFLWDATPEGYGYWREVYVRLDREYYERIRVRFV